MRRLTQEQISASIILLALSLTACEHPKQKFAITVTEVGGKPMEGINCSAGFNRSKTDGTGIIPYVVSGKTDAEGKLRLSGETVFFDTSVRCRTEGYYDSIIEKLFITGKNAGRWEPWPVEVKLVMKKVGNPKPMYVVQFDGQQWLDFPEKKLGPFGFDLMAGDWVGPYGVGTVADFILKGVRESPDERSQYPKGSVILSFSNPEDGMISLKEHGGSILVGPGVAPEDGYQNHWEFVNWKPHPTGASMVTWDFNDEVHIFRVRTKVDESGNLVSAHYGKIHGRILGRMSKIAPRILMTYYLNGTPNDRGLEWDMRTNLIQNTSRMRIPERP
jgi:hypothetical protein